MATTKGRVIPLEELELLDEELELLDDELELLELEVLEFDEDELLEEDELLDELELEDEVPVPPQPTTARDAKQAKSQPVQPLFIFMFFIIAFQIDSQVLLVLQIRCLPRYLILAPNNVP
jgi:hypothetical protein